MLAVHDVLIMTETETRSLFESIKSELAAQGLALPAGWRLVLDARCSRRLGQCRHGGREIGVSRKFAALNGPAAVGATIRHEIAHALVGPRKHPHDHVWKAMAIRCGDTGDRCCDPEAEGVIVPKGKEAKWAATCPGCGSTHRRHRPLRPGRASSCRNCSGGRYNAAFRLHYATAETARREPVDPSTLTAIERKVLALRAAGLGYVKIDAVFGVYGKKGFWSWKIVKEKG